MPMKGPAKLLLFAVVLAGVFGVSYAVGSALDPVGMAQSENGDDGAHGGAGDEPHTPPGLAVADDGFRIVTSTTSLRVGSATAFAFEILDDDGRVVREFDVEHTKRMHLIVVRRDLSQFVHLHPELDQQGAWVTDLTVDAPGTYRAFADFAVDGEKHTLGVDLFAPGEVAPEAIRASSRTVDAGDGYSATLAGEAVAGEESTLSFQIHRRGEPVSHLPHYLGAAGHLVVLRAGDLAFLHVHPETDRLAFDAEFPTAGTYALYLQFDSCDGVRTARFVIDVEDAG